MLLYIYMVLKYICIHIHVMSPQNSVWLLPATSLTPLGFGKQRPLEVYWLNQNNSLSWISLKEGFLCKLCFGDIKVTSPQFSQSQEWQIPWVDETFTNLPCWTLLTWSIRAPSLVLPDALLQFRQDAYTNHRQRLPTACHSQMEPVFFPSK